MNKRRLRRAAMVAMGLAAVLVGAVVLSCRGELWFRMLPEFVWSGRNAQGRDEYRHRQTGLVFVHVPDYAHGELFVSRTEVSGRVWCDVMQWKNTELEKSNYPIRGVALQQCRDFCLRTGLIVPASRQWDFVSRRAFSEGVRSQDMPRRVYLEVPTSNGPREISEGEPDALGILNLYGNVEEWCDDVVSEAFGSVAIRGCAWDYLLEDTEKENSMMHPDNPDPHIGLRPFFILGTER